MNPSLLLTVQYASETANLPTRAQFRRWVRAALEQDASITIRVADAPEARRLNRTYRGKDYATNVLTFTYDDEGHRKARRVSGDVVICAPVVEREAGEQHKVLLEHYAHLTIHAILHLQGYAHENDADAAAMEALETKLMLELHYHDPYQAG